MNKETKPPTKREFSYLAAINSILKDLSISCEDHMKFEGGEIDTIMQPEELHSGRYENYKYKVVRGNGLVRITVEDKDNSYTRALLNPVFA